MTNYIPKVFWVFPHLVFSWLWPRVLSNVAAIFSSVTAMQYDLHHYHSNETVKRPLPWWNNWVSIRFSSLHNVYIWRLQDLTCNEKSKYQYYLLMLIHTIYSKDIYLNMHCSTCVSFLWHPHTSGCCRPYCSDAVFLPSSALVNQPLLKPIWYWWASMRMSPPTPI